MKKYHSKAELPLEGEMGAPSNCRVTRNVRRGEGLTQSPFPCCCGEVIKVVKADSPHIAWGYEKKTLLCCTFFWRSVLHSIEIYCRMYHLLKFEAWDNLKGGFFSSSQSWLLLSLEMDFTFIYNHFLSNDFLRECVHGNQSRQTDLATL